MKQRRRLLLSGGPGTHWVDPVARKEEVASTKKFPRRKIPEGSETVVEKVRGESRVE